MVFGRKTCCPGFWEAAAILSDRSAVGLLSISAPGCAYTLSSLSAASAMSAERTGESVLLILIDLNVRARREIIAAQVTSLIYNI